MSSTSSDICHENNGVVSDSEPEDGDTTISYANKICGIAPTPPAVKPFKFRSFLKDDNKENVSPSSSPIPLPSPDPILIISSDEELENSMLMMDDKISLEMESN